MEIRIGGLKNGIVTAGTGSHDHVRSRHGNALCPGSPRQIMRHSPDLIVNVKFW